MGINCCSWQISDSEDSSETDPNINYTHWHFELHKISKSNKTLIFHQRPPSGQKIVSTGWHEPGVLTSRGHWNSWPCKTADRQIHDSSEMVDPAALHTLPPLSADTKHKQFFHCFVLDSLHIGGLFSPVYIRLHTSRTWASTAAQGEEKSEGTMGHRASCGSASTQLFPNISMSCVSTPGRQKKTTIWKTAWCAEIKQKV